VELQVALSRISPPVRRFLEAAGKGDSETLLSVCAPRAIVDDEDGEAAMPVAEWCERLFSTTPLFVRPLHAVARSDGVVVGVMVSGRYAGTRTACLELDWTFIERGGQINAVKIRRRPTHVLPAVVASTIQAVNLGDMAGLLRTVGVDGLVVDQGRCHWGIDAIRKWAQTDVVDERLTLLVMRAHEHHGATIVVAYVDGDFDRRGLPDPLILACYFRLKEERVIELIIMRMDEL
jgi:hypothetical protein